MQSRRLSTVLGACVAIAFGCAAPALAGSVSGRVVDPSGKPVAGARVAWVAYQTDDQTILNATRGVEPAVLGETATGADGAFRVVL
ncbi:MAG TPA: carboxypeptidase-like regulatory domain-containing protein, partial [Thermoanaerobaculia bacterium]|nr:carboxypeptidase-like regulatory domain-containing protein [Thermoanaerobaculia bacterium]